MSWGRCDDGFYRHAKVASLREAIALECVGLHWLAISWCNDQLTDGRVPMGMVRRLGARSSLASELVRVGLWEVAADEPTDYLVHDFLQFNQSKAEVLAQREIDRRRSAMNANPELARAVKERDSNRCRYCGTYVDWRDRKSPRGATYDHIVPMSRGGDDSVDNIVVCCRSCNMRKGALPLAEIKMTLLDPPTDTKQISNGGSSPPLPVTRYPSPVNPSPTNPVSVVRDPRYEQTRRELQDEEERRAGILEAPMSPLSEFLPRPK